MGAKRYVALLRGINVGGKNIVPMADLRAAFETEGYESVRTYIQSGNVLFESGAPRGSLESELEAMLLRQLETPIRVVLRSHVQLRNVVQKAPRGFGTKPDTYHSDAVFLKSPLTSQQAMRVVELRDGVDKVWPGTGVVYFQRLSERRTQSKLNKVASAPEYQQMTIRSWSTTTKLLDLLEN
jgi:uncharacterized protein (DUF1697 family)